MDPKKAKLCCCNYYSHSQNLYVQGISSVTYFNLFFPASTFILLVLSSWFFLIYIYFNWRIIALQNFVVLCQTSTWISHRCKYVPSLLNLLSPEFPVLPSVILILALLFPKFWFSSIYDQNWWKKNPIIENQWGYEHLYEMMGTRQKKWSFTEVGYPGVSNIWILAWCIKPLDVSLT